MCPTCGVKLLHRIPLNAPCPNCIAYHRLTNRPCHQRWENTLLQHNHPVPISTIPKPGLLPPQLTQAISKAKASIQNSHILAPPSTHQDLSKEDLQQMITDNQSTDPFPPKYSNTSCNIPYKKAPSMDKEPLQWDTKTSIQLNAALPPQRTKQTFTYNTHITQVRLHSASTLQPYKILQENELQSQ
jgi:hypothetical protein